jgi:hypothetical protein
VQRPKTVVKWLLASKASVFGIKSLLSRCDGKVLYRLDVLRVRWAGCAHSDARGEGEPLHVIYSHSEVVPFLTHTRYPVGVINVCLVSEHLSSNNERVDNLGYFTTSNQINPMYSVETVLHRFQSVYRLSCVLSRAWLRRLVIGLSPRRPDFDHGSIHVGFMVGKVTLGQVASVASAAGAFITKKKASFWTTGDSFPGWGKRSFFANLQTGCVATHT